ncbi:hypothetical protein GCM10009765_47080 [Fodinicola feengrottensis]|uniref:Uncharacterized protein n=1 Tax=Fodinicola feengrottensis TaxID=435914 RepID=A0ABN2HRN7_9ACTN
MGAYERTRPAGRTGRRRAPLDQCHLADPQPSQVEGDARPHHTRADHNNLTLHLSPSSFPQVIRA